MWPVWGSWSLRSSQTTEHSSSGRKVKVCLFCFGHVQKDACYCSKDTMCICLMHVQYPRCMFTIHISLFVYLNKRVPFIHTCVCTSTQLRETTGWLYCRTAPGGAIIAAPWTPAHLCPQSFKDIWSSGGYAPNFILLWPQKKYSSTKTLRWELPVCDCSWAVVNIT